MTVSDDTGNRPWYLDILNLESWILMTVSDDTAGCSSEESSLGQAHSHLEFLNSWILESLNPWILESLNLWILESLNLDRHKDGGSFEISGTLTLTLTLISGTRTEDPSRSLQSKLTCWEVSEQATQKPGCTGGENTAIGRPWYLDILISWILYLSG